MHRLKSWLPTYGLLLTGLLLVLACVPLQAGAALACLWLAQVPVATAIAMLRGTHAGNRGWRHAGTLALLWAVAGACAGILLGWPLATLMAHPGLGKVLWVSGLAGVLTCGLWRQADRWRWLEVSGGGLRQALTLPHPHPRASWRALLQIALPVLLLLVGGMLLAWPGLLQGGGRLLAVAGYAVLLPLAHAWLQIAPGHPLLDGLPEVETASPKAWRNAVELEMAAAIAVPAERDADVQAVDQVDAAALTAELYQAARSGRVERALALLTAGADPLALPEADARDRRSLPVLAAVLPDLRLLRALIERGVDLNALHGGSNPLLAATRDSWHGRPEAVMTLLANGADPRVMDAEGNTPLHHAMRSTDPGVAALLRDAGAELEAQNHDGLSPLGSACAAGNWRLARFLLERGARPEPETGHPALLSAAAIDDDDPAGVQLLLRHKARVNARNLHGRSALHEAALAGHVEIAQALLAAGAEVNACDDEGRTPLLDAVRVGALPMLELLLGADAAVRACDGNAANALHLACAAELPSPELVRDLLALGVDPLATNADGNSAIDLVVASKRWDLLAILDPQRTPSALQPDDDAPPERPPLLRLRELLLEGRLRDADAVLPQLATGQLAQLLVDEEVSATPAVLDWLLRQGANPETRMNAALSPLQTALAQGRQAIPRLRQFLACGAAATGGGSLSRFLLACAPGETDAESFALELLARGADPFAGVDGGDPPLLQAVRLGWLHLLQGLIACGVALDVHDERGMSALHVAVALGRGDVVKQLVAAGASPDLRAADGQTPLGIALACGRRDLADWLDWRGWKLPKRALQAVDVPAAAMAGDLAALRRLLDHGFPVDAVDAQGCSALLRAAGGGHRELVEFLLARGANPELAANTGATPLSAAVSMRHPEIVDLLLRAGCGLEQRLPGEVTILMLAAALGLPELVTRLLQAGADLQVTDAQGLTPLHCAALYGFTARDRTRLVALLDVLLLAGADAHRQAHGGVTPLLLLLGARAEPGTPSSEDVLLAAVERLLDEDVHLEVQDARGYTALHLAGLHGLLRVAQLLLREGADPGQRDAQGHRPYDIATARGYMDVANELAQPVPAPRPGVSMARFLRDQ